MNSQNFESYVPVYDTVPEEWEDARDFLVEHLKKISNAVNIREIGYLLDEELLSGKSFIPGVTAAGNPKQFRSILRKVISCGALAVGVNPPIPHGIVFDANFTLIDLWVSATNSTALQAVTLAYSNVYIDVNNINITSPGVFNRSYCVIEYIQEL